MILRDARSVFQCSGGVSEIRYILKDQRVIDNCIQDIKNSLGMEVTIGKPKRSNPQNALMWSLITVIANYTGDTPEDIHERLKVSFLGVEHKTVRGVDLVMPISTTSLNTKQFTEYLDKIYALGNTLNIRLPYPQDLGYENDRT